VTEGVVHEIGRHRLRVGSVFDNLASLSAGTRPHVMYTDPPWGQGMMKYFANKRAQDTGIDTPIMDYQELLVVVCRYAKAAVAGPVFIEYGLRWDAEVRAVAAQAGLQWLATLQTRYSGGKLPQHLHIFWANGTPAPDFVATIGSEAYRARMAASKGGATNPTAALQPFATTDAIVVDPCCGLGVVAKAAIGLKMRFFGNELNVVRAARTREVLLKDRRP
jgi:hypothetical protein